MLIANKKVLFVLIVLMVFVTIGLPLLQIVRYENVIKNGTLYKIKCRAYDPYDPFMGRYVRLNASETVLQKDFKFVKDVSKNDRFYSHGFVEISADENGFVKYEKLIKNNNQILNHKNYLKCNIRELYRSEEDVSKGIPRKIRVRVENLDRYYMSDKLAKPAEDAIRDVLATRSDDSDVDEVVYVELKVLNTLAVPMQLYVNDIKIEDYIKAYNPKMKAVNGDLPVDEEGSGRKKKRRKRR